MLRSKRACLFNRQAFLLVEATLTAAVIAVGLVFISRGMATSLHTLSRLRQQEVLLRLAESAMAEREAVAQSVPAPDRQEGRFEAPHEAYQWTLTAGAVEPSVALPEAIREVTLTVSRIDRPSVALNLTTLWPTDWLKE